MSDDKSELPLLSRISLRIALAGGIAGGIITGGILKVVTELATPAVVLLSLISAFLGGLIIYGWSYRLHHSRLNTLHRIATNISRKQFESYDDVKFQKSDEIDYLTIHLVKASKKVEKEIQRLNKIENYRKEFIGDISHELKTPIFAIQGFIETLLNGAIDDPEVNEVFLQKAMRNVNRLTYLTKDLMEISKLETGELKSKFQDIFLLDMVIDVVENLQYKAQKERVSLNVMEFDKNLQVRADRHQIKQVLINLLENAIKYNVPDGYVEVGIKPDKKDPDRIRLYTKDSGIGIDPKDIPRVTERFFRVDKSRSREKGGTGLGLSIVKHIIEAHGENLYIESGEEGTIFSFTLTKANYILNDMSSKKE